MIGPWGRPTGTRVAPKNVDQIRRIALNVRKHFKMFGPKIDMIDLLENTLRQHGIHFHIVEAHEIPGEAARAIPKQGKILITLEAYEALHDRDPLQELLVPHEAGHFALRHYETAVFSRESAWFSHTALEDSEVQADRFSHEFVMPVDLIQQECHALLDIQQIFNVPSRDARIRMEQLRQEKLITW